MAERKNTKSNKCIIAVIILIAIVLIVPYTICFRGYPISHSTSEWGAFSDYLSLGIGILSVILIYITYAEQQKANRISLFEQHLGVITSTIKILNEENEPLISSVYGKFCNHFQESIADFSDMNVEYIKGVFTYYYSLALDETTHDLSSYFQYVSSGLNFIVKEKYLPCKDLEGRLSEMCCLIPESSRVLYLCWTLLKNDNSWIEFFKEGLWNVTNPNLSLLSEAIAFICMGRVEDSNIFHNSNDNTEPDIGDYSKEKFPDTYKRLFCKQ